MVLNTVASGCHHVGAVYARWPQVEEDMDTSAAPASFVEDAADVDRRNAAALAEQAALEFARRSSALKREPPLPRVTVVDEDAIACASSHADASLAAADTLIKEELVTLLQHDAVKFPVRVSAARLQARLLTMLRSAASVCLRRRSRSRRVISALSRRSSCSQMTSWLWQLQHWRLKR